MRTPFIALAAAGGLTLALAMGRTLDVFLFGLTPYDPATVLATARMIAPCRTAGSGGSAAHELVAGS